MLSNLKPAFLMLLLLTLLTGVIYPALVTVFAQVFYADKANGSLIKDQQGNLLGSQLIGQPFSDPKYFWGRASATSPYPYNSGASSGSNLGPTNPDLVEAVKIRVATLHTVDPNNNAPIPVDLITASASGLDSHISPVAAEYQVNRIAKVRKMDSAKLRDLVRTHTEGRQWGLFGEPRVNVLNLNLALNAKTATTAKAKAPDLLLPPSNVGIELCRKKALLEHPGEIDKERILDRLGQFLVEYNIQGPDGKEWQVLCDLKSGLLIRE
jgi:potassium-transporting ATPase KdpC subunit